MTDIKHAALSKVDRANRHFKELEACVKVFAESEFYSISKDIDPRSGNPCARAMTLRAFRMRWTALFRKKGS